MIDELLGKAKTLLAIELSQAGVEITNMTTKGSVKILMSAMTARVTMSATLHANTTEDGRTIVDGKTIQPFKIDIVGMATNFDELVTLKDLVGDMTSYFSVKINGVTWDEVFANRIDIDQSAEYMSVSPITMAFSKVLTRRFGYVDVANGEDSPNRNIGDVAPKGSTLTIQQYFENLLRRI